jgi:hypothetical protein
VQFVEHTVRYRSYDDSGDADEYYSRKQGLEGCEQFPENRHSVDSVGLVEGGKIVNTMPEKQTCLRRRTKKDL